MPHHDLRAPKLYRLIYFSRQALADDEDHDLQIGQIITKSIVNNRRCNVTGLLLVHQDWFVQALEGPHAGVQATYERIVRDTRHRAAQILTAEAVDHRCFKSWNMCARRISDADEIILETLHQRGVFDPQRLTPGGATQLLTAVATIQGERGLARYADEMLPSQHG